MYLHLGIPGLSRLRWFLDIRTENLKIAHLTQAKLLWMRNNVFMFDRFVQDAYIPPHDGPGGRLVPVTELQEQYPDDHGAGADWTKQTRIVY